MVKCSPALLPATDSAFGRGGHMTHALYVVPARDAAYLKLQDPVLDRDRATIVGLRWPAWDEGEQRYKALQTVFPPSLRHTGGTVEWVRDGAPADVSGADLVPAVKGVGAAVLLARYARHKVVLRVANLLARAGWADDAKAVRFLAAVFTAKGTPTRRPTRPADNPSPSGHAGNFGAADRAAPSTAANPAHRVLTGPRPPSARTTPGAGALPS